MLMTFGLAMGQTNQTSQKLKSTAPLIDVWDFGAEQLDPAIYNNQLNTTVINGWYTYSATIVLGTASTNNVFPASFAAVGGLSWNGGSNDRLRTTNTALTRYDVNIASVTGYTGRLYQNGTGTTTPTRYFTFSLNEDDEVSLVTKADATGKINFTNAVSGQADSYVTSSSLVTLKFVAKTTGSYKIYDSAGKPSYFRIYRKPATYTAVTGAVNIVEAADIPAGYGIVFTNAAGKSWTALADSHTYSASLPAGYTYNVSLANANGYVITTSKTITVDENPATFDLSVKKVELYTTSGSISGLGTDIAKLGLSFTPSVASSYVPEPVINTTNSTYTVQLEANNNYTVAATGVNDYSIVDNAVVVAQAAVTKDVVFAAKPVYGVTVNTLSLAVAQQNALTLTFTNLNESGYSYVFAPGASISLRVMRWPSWLAARRILC